MLFSTVFLWTLTLRTTRPTVPLTIFCLRGKTGDNGAVEKLAIYILRLLRCARNNVKTHIFNSPAITHFAIVRLNLTLKNPPGFYFDSLILHCNFSFCILIFKLKNCPLALRVSSAFRLLTSKFLLFACLSSHSVSGFAFYFKNPYNLAVKYIVS